MTAGLTIIVAFHQPCRLPEDPAYLPVLVGGSECDHACVRDNTGDHIAGKNPWYSELTALYWAWKNLDVEYLGLAHYRRYFATSPFLLNREQKWRGILTGKQAARILEQQPVILPRPRHYYIESKYSHFAHAHGKNALIAARQTIQDRFPGYLSAWDTTMASRSGHIFNMFIMRRDILDTYCAWFFEILFAAEDALRKTTAAMNPRIMGYLGERLLDVWLEVHKPPCAELPVVNTETLNWPSKVTAFLLRAIRRQREEKPENGLSAL
ncbi:MAG: DUF4422 domain-containing protein [Desulfovibrionaceae bacterium]|nr:DUF4422 domain-containing protein [Desulfovibrionaceae bacterium]